MPKDLTTLWNFSCTQDKAHENASALLQRVNTAIGDAQQLEHEVEFMEQFGKPFDAPKDLATLRAEYDAKVSEVNALMHQYVDAFKPLIVGLKSFTESIAA